MGPLLSVQDTADRDERQIMGIELRSAACSINLTGVMNSSIHYPMWYRLVGLIDEKEEKYALESGEAMLLPPPQSMARFDAGPFQIRCDVSNWEIKTSRPEYVSRIRHISQEVFDKILPHTRVSGFWVHFSFSYETSNTGVGHTLGAWAQSLPVDFGLTDPDSAQIMMQRRDGEIRISVDVAQGNSPSVARIGTTVQVIRVPESGAIGFWNIKDYFEPSFERYRQEAGARAASIARTIDEGTRP